MTRKFHHRHLPPAPRKQRRDARISPLAFVFAILLAAFGAGYLFEINIASSKGYEIRSLERQVGDLKEERERLEVQVAQGQSVQAIEAKVQAMGMVPTSQLEYVAVTTPTVAQR